MRITSNADLKTLLESETAPCVSIYLPTVRAGRETRQNPIRFKNLFDDAAQRLGRTHSAAEVKRFLRPLERLLDDHEFWQHQGEGLALFCSGEIVSHFECPSPFAERVAVGSSFYIKPLLPLMSGDGAFYILAMSRNDVRLLSATRHTVQTLNVPQMPRSLADAIALPEPEKQLQYHTHARGGKGRGETIFHGQGGGKNDEKADLLHFCRRVDQAVESALPSEKAPLVLACVEQLAGLYREASGHHGLLDAFVEGNFDDADEMRLHDRAWPTVAPLFKERQTRATEEFLRLDRAGKTTSDVGEALMAATEGRVGILFVALDAEQWGRFDPQSRLVDVHAEPDESDEDLVDAAARAALLTDADVFAVERKRLPNPAFLNAAYRY